ncbi:MAG: hypothetical protein WKF43_05975 [Acidimicrobiales bacterium]
MEEETSLQGLCGDFVGWTEVLVPEVHAVILTFRLHLLRFEEPVAGGDAAEARWVLITRCSGIASWPVSASSPRPRHHLRFRLGGKLRDEMVRSLNP